MTTSRLFRASTLAVGIVITSTMAAASSEAYTRPGHTERVSVTSSGRHPSPPTTLNPAQGTPPSTSISADGRYVAFQSELALVPEDVNAAVDIYVHDRLTGETELVSKGFNGGAAIGAPGNLVACKIGTGRGWDWSCNPSISANGRYVAFDSVAVNLVPGDTNLDDNVYVYDRKTHLTSLASVNRDGSFPSLLDGPGLGVPPSSVAPSISADGRFVSFTSLAKSLVAHDTNDAPDIFVRDRLRKRTLRVSVASDGSQSAGSCNRFLGCDSVSSVWPLSSISGNGRFVAFDSLAPDLVKGDSDNTFDVFVHDLRTRTTERVSVASDGSQGIDPQSPGDSQGPTNPRQGGSTIAGEGQSTSVGRVISDDGRYVTFVSHATNLVPNDTNYEPFAWPGGVDLFVRDRKTDRTERVSVTASGEETDYSDVALYNCCAAISPSGRFVAFMGNPQRDTRGGPLTRTGPLSGWSGLVVYDRTTGATFHVDHNRLGFQGKDYFGAPSLSGSGRYLAFSADPYAFAPKDAPPQPYSWDVWVRDLGPDLGVGGLSGSNADGARRLTLSGSPSFSSTGVASSTDPSSDLSHPLTNEGANLIGASLAYRPQYRDLFVRLELQSMTTFALANPAVVYGLDLRVRGERYEVRASAVSGQARFGLFRRDGGQWTTVADLRGGYGTTGDEVVFAVPLQDLGLQRGGALGAAHVFTALGSFDVGPVVTLDTAGF